MALPALMEELVEEILLRIPPDEPAQLIHASLVCKGWRRIVSDRGFRCRYFRFHRAPPLLGYIRHRGVYAGGPQLVASSAGAFWPQAMAPAGPGGDIFSYALDCRHGRVLIYSAGGGGAAGAAPRSLIVWDPITGGQEHLSMPADYVPNTRSFTAAVLCALHGHGCDHIDCHGGSFVVVFVATRAVHATHTWAAVYSSEAGAWSAAQAASTDTNDCCLPARRRHSLLIGDTLYFTLVRHNMIRILKYDLRGGGGGGGSGSGHRTPLSMIDDTPPVYLSHDTAVPIEIDGRLGLVELSYSNCIYKWQATADANGGVGGGWVRDDDNGIQLQTLIPPPRRRGWYHRHPNDTIRFAEGTNTVFISMNNSMAMGVFTLDLKSRQMRKVAETCDAGILPYTSFYTLLQIWRLRVNRHFHEDATVQTS